MLPEEALVARGEAVVPLDIGAACLGGCPCDVVGAAVGKGTRPAGAVVGGVQAGTGPAAGAG